eukprot:6205446-Pleurochrysis_carterae.AAC.1
MSLSVFNAIYSSHCNERCTAPIRRLRAHICINTFWRLSRQVLDIVCVQTEEDTVQAGASDGLAELWQSMRAGHPAIALLAPCPTRRARKQLLHKLSKQSCAAAYEWEALGGKDTTGQGTPCLDEGWARILE